MNFTVGQYTIGLYRVYGYKPDGSVYGGWRLTIGSGSQLHGILWTGGLRFKIDHTSVE